MEDLAVFGKIVGAQTRKLNLVRQVDPYTASGPNSFKHGSSELDGSRLLL